MSESRALCRVEDIPDNGAIAVHVDSSTGGFDIILMRQGEAVFGYDNECPHQDRQLDYVPGKFLVKEGCIMCAAHGALFKVHSGERVAGPCSTGLVRVPVRIEGAEVSSA